MNRRFRLPESSSALFCRQIIRGLDFRLPGSLFVPEEPIDGTDGKDGFFGGVSGSFFGGSVTARHRPPSTLSPLYPVGTLGRGTGPRNLACGGRLCVLERWLSEVEEVPDCSGLNGGVISNPPPPMTLRAGPQGREMGRLRSLATLSVPLPRGLLGNGMLPVFCSICRAPVGAIPNTSRNSDLLQQLTFAHFFHQERQESQLTWRVTTPPQKCAQFDQKRATLTTRQI